MNAENPSDFESMLDGVLPLETEPREVSPPGVAPKSPGQQLAMEDVERDQVDQSNPNYLTLMDTAVTMLAADQKTEFRESGVQQSEFEEMKSGRIRAERTLDLHRCTVEESRERVWKFLATGIAENLRTVQIRHGPGRTSERPAWLKSFVAHWMREHRDVIATCTAPRAAGGAGVTVVRLRKRRNRKRSPRE